MPPPVTNPPVSGRLTEDVNERCNLKRNPRPSQRVRIKWISVFFHFHPLTVTVSPLPWPAGLHLREIGLLHLEPDSWWATPPSMIPPYRVNTATVPESYSMVGLLVLECPFVS